MEFRRQLGVRIYKLRNEAGLTQNSLALKAGISVKYLQNLESKNPKSVSLEVIKRLCDALSISLSDFFKF